MQKITLIILLVLVTAGCAHNATNLKEKPKTPEINYTLIGKEVDRTMIYDGQTISVNADYICGRADKYILTEGR